MFDKLLEEMQKINEVNIPARLAADDLISSFTEAYQVWEDTYMNQLSAEEFRLARKMIIDILQQGLRAMVKGGRKY